MRNSYSQLGGGAECSGMTSSIRTMARNEAIRKKSSTVLYTLKKSSAHFVALHSPGPLAPASSDVAGRRVSKFVAAEDS